ncbi:MAG: class I SAM-dependent methyltransferase [Candidatus Vogelbacteria bacterium]|nr:class I SAM-dependent methyltransferase [Candidatus Vogelbacteria bacterium]
MDNLKNTRAVVAYLSKYISGKTLDFGAGSAKYKGLIASHTSEYITFDMVPGNNIDVTGDATDTPFSNDSFNTVISTQMLEHVEKPWVVVGEIRRILKPGGVCIITAPFMIPFHADPYDFFRYTKEGLESLFENESFIIEESGCYGKTPSVLAEMIHFSRFSHYEMSSLSKLKRKLRNILMRLIKATAYRLDALSKNGAAYANVYVVARKGVPVIIKKY